MSFLDYLLAGDKTDELQAIVDADAADLAAGITWGVYDGDRLVEVASARYMAECARHDNADGADRDVSDYEIRALDGVRRASDDCYEVGDWQVREVCIAEWAGGGTTWVVRSPDGGCDYLDGGSLPRMLGRVLDAMAEGGGADADSR